MEESKATRGLVLRAPLSGVLMPIERVPDPVLPQKMVGDEAAAASEVGGLNASEAILISNTAGLHARPAAVLANLARKYTSSIWMQRETPRPTRKASAA